MPVDAVFQRNNIGRFEYRTKPYTPDKTTQAQLKKMSTAQRLKPPQKINFTAALYFSSAIFLNLIKTANTPTTLEKSCPFHSRRHHDQRIDFPNNTASASFEANRVLPATTHEPVNLLEAMSSTVIFAYNTIRQLDNAVRYIDLIPMIGANAEPVKTAPGEKNTETPPNIEVLIEKIDHSCIIERSNLKFSGVLRKIGKTMSNPILEMVRESQIVYFYNKYGRCPKEAESEHALQAAQKADIVISYIISTTPESEPLYITQSLLGPLLVLFADALDDVSIEAEPVESINEQLVFVAKSIINTSLRDSQQKLIGTELKIPKGLCVKEGKVQIKINEKLWDITMIDNEFFVKKQGVIYPVIYQDDAWSFLENENEEPEIEDNNDLFGLNDEEVDILCYARARRGAGLRKICSLKTTAVEESHFLEISNDFSQGSVGDVYSANDDYVIKRYHARIDIDHTSRLKYAINTARSFSRIYGKGTAKISISPEPDGNGLATVYITMIRVPGMPLSEVSKITNPEHLIRLLAELRSKETVPELLSKLQENGVKHNDINLANILYEPGIGFNLIDFDSSTLLPQGESIPDGAMQEMNRKTRHAFNEADRMIQKNIDLEALLTKHYGDKIKIALDHRSNTYRIGKFTIREFASTKDRTKLIHHEVGACNHVMKIYGRHDLKAIKYKDAVIYPHIEGVEPTRKEIMEKISTLYHQNMMFAGACESDFVKTPEGEIIPTHFNTVFSKNRIDRLHFRLKKNIVINYVHSGHRFIPQKIKPMYSEIINNINHSLGERRPTKHMRKSALVRAGLRQARKQSHLHANT